MTDLAARPPRLQREVAPLHGGRRLGGEGSRQRAATHTIQVSNQ